MLKKLPYKKILSILLLVLYVYAVFIISRIGKASADIKAFQITKAKVVEKADTADAEISIDDKDNVKTNFIFHKVNDFIVFDLTFKNNDNKDYYVKSIIDDNTNPHVIYDYDQHKDEKIKAGKTITIRVKLTYNDEVKDLTKRKITDEVKFSFDIEDIEGNKVFGNMPTNSRSFDTILGYIILALVLITVVVIIIVRNKKAKKVAAFLLLFVLVPLTTKAANSVSFQIVLKTEVKLHDKLVITVVDNGQEELVVVPYGESTETIKEPEKKGYDFVGWYQDGEEYTFDEELNDDVEVTPKYKLINYNITYDYNGGSKTNNPVNYNVESKTITLTNPTKDGYSFSGWTGSNGKTYQTKVTIANGSVGDLSFTANFSPKQDIKYTVVHKYKNFNGDGYSDEVVEELTGTTDTLVKPEARPVMGYVNPSLKTIKVTADGKATVEYVYERAMVTLAYSNDVISDIPAGIYKAGTKVTISAKTKTGYTFNRWNVYANALPTFADNDNNGVISVGDQVIIGADWFYVVGPAENGQVKLLPKYSLNKDGRQSAISDVVTFSNYHYWDGSSNYVPLGSSNNKYVYRTKDNEDTNNYLKARINTYKDYLNSLGGVSVLDARLMSYEEAAALGCTSYPGSCPEFISDQRFWLGSAQGQYLYTAGSGLLLYMKSYSYGVRPVVIIKESDISTTNASKSLSTIEIMENLNIIPSYDPNHNTPYTVIHKIQDVDDEELFTIAETENKTGVTGDTIRPPVLTAFGDDYQKPNTTPLTINPDGSAFIEYLYYYKYYNVTLDPNGGSINTESLKVVKGNPTSLSIPVREGFDFVGWYSAAEGGELLALPTDSYTPTRSITVYAHWKSNTPTEVIYIDHDYNNTLSAGDKVTIDNDEFYFIGYDANNNYKLLPKYNLDANYKQSEHNSVNIAFSDFAYWGKAGSVDSRSHYNLGNFGYFQEDSYYVSFINNSSNEYAFTYAYRTNAGEDVSDNNLTLYVNNYSNYLKSTYNLDVIDARLMTYKEATSLGCERDSIQATSHCPSYVSNQQYWLGNLNSYTDIYIIIGTNIHGNPYHSDDGGIRPVVILSNSTVIASTSGYVSGKADAIFQDTNDDSTASYGDKVIIGSDEFYFIGYDNDGNYKLLPKYNLDANYRQSENNAVTLSFASEDYWSELTIASASNPDYPFVYYGTDNKHNQLYVYNDKNGNTYNQNNLTSYVNNYVSYLENRYSITIVDARLLRLDEVNKLGCNLDKSHCPAYVNNQSYWLGDVCDDEYEYINAVNSDSEDTTGTYYSLDNSAGARPLIIISKDNVKTPWDKVAKLEDLDHDLDASLGDKVTIGNDVFYFIGYDDDGNYKLLPKYNLDANYRQSFNNAVTLAFSSEDYWSEMFLASESGDSQYPFEVTGSNTILLYRDINGNTVPQNNLTSYVNNYASYLESTYGIELVDARLFTNTEIDNDAMYEANSCPSFICNQSYWLGDVDTDESSLSHPYYANSSSYEISNERDEINDNSIMYNNDQTNGVRPIVIISPSYISLPWDNAKKVISDMDQSNDISIGDVVRIYNDTFWVAGRDGDNIKLLSKYYLSANNSTQVRYGSNYKSVNFSDTPYWANHLSDYSNSYVYRTADGNSTDNNVKDTVNAYALYLNNQISEFDISDVRLMSYEEALAIRDTVLTFTNYRYPFWLGSARANGNIYYYSSGSIGYGDYKNNNHLVVPLVNVPESDLLAN